MKEQIKAGREALHRLWQGGLSGRSLLLRHTEIIDTNLSEHFQTLAEAAGDLALVALGGYGRRELFPFSDIDLLLLHSPSLEQDRLKQAAETIFYPLWDSGLEVGHSVRSPADCLADCEGDFHLQTALLDARLVTGNRRLLDELLEKYRLRYIEGHRRDFLARMTDSRTQRHKSFGRHSFQLEPNIKEGRGGFRDYQTMIWTARVIFGLNGTDAMTEAGLLTAEEHQRVEAGYDRLVKVRNRLHYACGRKNDQLFYEHQEEIATTLGYRNAPGRLGVETFMQEVYGALQNIAVISTIFFEHTEEIIDRPQSSTTTPRSFDGNWELRHNHLSLIDPEQLHRHHFLLMKIFCEAAARNLPIHYRTRQTIANNLDLIDDNFRHSRQLARDFLRIFSSSGDPLESLTAMLESGFLTAYLPEFLPILGLAQHDLYHVFTVDRHLLQAVAEIRSLATELPEIFANIQDPDILYLATLLHDIGKGHERDHSRAGAEIAGQVGGRLGLKESELGDLDFLVRHHLFLSHTAQRRDLEDAGLIGQCLETIGNRQRLDMLYLLSIADARATGPAASNDWKMALFQELYLKIRHGLEHHPGNRDMTQAGRWMREQVEKLLGKTNPTAIANLTDDYLTNFTPREIVEHLRLREELAGRNILTVPSDRGDHWSILVISRDSTGLLSRICGVLALNNLDVLAAKIHTWNDGTVVDLIEVRPITNSDFAGRDWGQLDRELELALGNRLGLAHRLADKNRPGLTTKAGHRHHQTQVRIDNASSELYTIIEIFADDQPALLYNITKTMADFEINITRALISTRREQLVDVFYVRDGAGAKITDPDELEEIRQALHFAAGH